MCKTYLGHLPEQDPLFHYLKDEIQPKIAVPGRRVKYRVFQLHGSNDVYLYEEKYSGTKVIGKFFLNSIVHDPAVANRRLVRECHNLARMREFGFDASPHYIARPLGCNPSLNELLVIEYCYGELLSSIIRRSIQSHDDGLLYSKLTALAYFLAAFHNRTVTGMQVNFDDSCAYADTLIDRLRTQQLIDDNCVGELRYLRDRWREHPDMWADRQVIVHGDATPENFMFGDGLNVISFDLERLRPQDRIFDTGRIAGELMHFFLLNTGNKYAAEPFIGHFLWEYACHFPDRERTFQTTTRRIPFFMGITFLRIARNDWLAWDYRRKLVHEGKLCLRRWNT